jgi:predicted O-methyltransferase YrrM
MSTDNVAAALWSTVEDYFAGALLRLDPALDAALADSAAAGLPAIAVAPAEGKLLQLLARLANAKRILEVGTLGGYSTIWLARSLPPGGKVITLEISATHADVARRNLARAKVDDRVEVWVAPAAESLARLLREKGPPFDFVFIDADKENNVAYFTAALALARPGTVIVVDNVVRDGEVANAASTNAMVRGVRALIDLVAREPRVDATALQTVGKKGYDGFLIAVVASVA